MKNGKNQIIKSENAENKVGIFERIGNWWNGKTTGQKIGTVVLTLLAGYGTYSGITNLMDDGIDDEDGCGEEESTDE